MIHPDIGLDRLRIDPVPKSITCCEQWLNLAHQSHNSLDQRTYGWSVQFIYNFLSQYLYCAKHDEDWSIFSSIIGHHPEMVDYLARSHRPSTYDWFCFEIMLVTVMAVQWSRVRVDLWPDCLSFASRKAHSISMQSNWWRELTSNGNNSRTRSLRSQECKKATKTRIAASVDKTNPRL